MITILTVLGFLKKFGGFLKPVIPFAMKHWKNILLAGFLVWVIICCMSHCGNTRFGNSEGVDTVSVEIDTVWMPVDTNAIFTLYGFDTIAQYITQLENRREFKPQAPVIIDADNSADSLSAYIQLLEESNRTLLECDSLFGASVAIRTYQDTLENDSISIALEIQTKGELFGEPKLSYRYLAPYPIITKTITVKETITVGPFRKVYLEGGAGPMMNWGNGLDAISGSIGLGYTDKKNWSYGGRGTFNQNGYLVEVTLRKSFNVSK